MKESIEVTTMLKNMCTRISAIKANGGDCGLALYNELISVDYLFTENDMWFVADSLGYTEEVFGAIICSKIVTSKSIFRMLQFAGLNPNLCWLTLCYYKSQDLHKQIMQAVEKTGLLKFKRFLTLINPQSPLDRVLDIHPVDYQSQAPCYHA